MAGAAGLGNEFNFILERSTEYRMSGSERTVKGDLPGLCPGKRLEAYCIGTKAEKDSKLFLDFYSSAMGCNHLCQKQRESIQSHLCIIAFSCQKASQNHYQSSVGVDAR